MYWGGGSEGGIGGGEVVGEEKRRAREGMEWGGSPSSPVVLIDVSPGPLISKVASFILPCLHSLRPSSLPPPLFMDNCARAYIHIPEGTL